MKPAKTLFEGLGYQSPDVVSLNVGAPGPATLKRCAELMIKATQARLVCEILDASFKFWRMNTFRKTRSKQMLSLCNMDHLKAIHLSSRNSLDFLALDMEIRLKSKKISNSKLSAFIGAESFRISLVTTAGATNGLHVMLTVLFPQRAPVFVEELTYHLALSMLEGDFKFPVIPGRWALEKAAWL